MYAEYDTIHAYVGSEDFTILPEELNWFPFGSMQIQPHMKLFRSTFTPGEDVQEWRAIDSTVNWEMFMTLPQEGQPPLWASLLLASGFCTVENSTKGLQYIMGYSRGFQPHIIFAHSGKLLQVCGYQGNFSIDLKKGERPVLNGKGAALYPNTLLPAFDAGPSKPRLPDIPNFRVTSIEVSVGGETFEVSGLILQSNFEFIKKETSRVSPLQGIIAEVILNRHRGGISGSFTLSVGSEGVKRLVAALQNIGSMSLKAHITQGKSQMVLEASDVFIDPQNWRDNGIPFYLKKNPEGFESLNLSFP